MMDNFLKIIQLMLAPSVMISACGLLLLGINNKYSNIVNRIRLLNEERRRFFIKIRDGKELDYVENIRLESITKQSKKLLNRLRLVRNCVLSYAVGIFLFILTSLLIGLEIFLELDFTKILQVISFVGGMMSVAIGVLLALLETLKGYKIVELEVKADE
ncbi:MAG: DUF2721 domain-containing protein [Ignavibacteria bacterium]|nr:DUF2721 domain-containing protein [Ignavibacteria bacterium]